LGCVDQDAVTKPRKNYIREIVVIHIGDLNRRGKNTVVQYVDQRAESAIAVAQ